MTKKKEVTAPKKEKQPTPKIKEMEKEVKNDAVLEEKSAEVKEVTETAEVKKEVLPEEKSTEERYKEVYHKYKDLTGAFPNPEWQLDQLDEEFNKALKTAEARQAKKEVVRNIEPNKSIKVKPGYVAILNTKTNTVTQISLTQYNLVKSMPNIVKYQQPLPELEGLKNE